jgi:LysR family glycine cleavage system transcriptional activator
MLAVEAAGRLGSFKAAAEELHLTRSAVSQQVKAVEEALGSELFERRGRSVVLTSQGERYLRRVRQALRDMRDAGHALRKPAEAPVLRLETVPFVAHEFLMPRMASLRARFPQFSVRLETNMNVIDLRTSEVDAAIRLSPGMWPGVVTRNFGEVTIAAVCAPQLANTVHEFKDLANQTLIEVQGFSERGLVNGLRRFGVEVGPEQVLTFDTYFETVRAAEHGLGVASGIFPLTTHWVTSGRLAVPFPTRFPFPAHVSLVHRVGDERFPFEELSLWLAEQYAALPPLPPGRIVPRAKKAQAKASARPSR